MRFFNEDPENEKPFFGFDSEYDDDEDDDDDDDDLEEETIAFIQSQDLMHVMQIGIAQSELRHHLLEKAIHIAESHWLWRFKTAAAKTAEIAMIYSNLQIITEVPEEPSSENSVE